VAPNVAHDLLFGGLSCGSRFRHNDRNGTLSPALIWHGDDCRLTHAGALQKDVLQLE